MSELSQAEDSRVVAETSRDRIRNVAERWRDQYGHDPANPRWAEVLVRLDALDVETATAEDVEAIIGNPTWTRQYCDVCGEGVEAWVRLGDEPDYESATIYACADCLANAYAALARILSEAKGR